MLKIRDYLILKEIYTYIEDRRDIVIREDNGLNDNEIDELTKFVNGLYEILEKLEEG